MAKSELIFGKHTAVTDWTENAITESFVGRTKTLHTKNAAFGCNSYPLCGIVVDGKFTNVLPGTYPSLVYGSYDESTNILSFAGDYTYTVMYEPMD